MKNYDINSIESFWQNFWEINNIFVVKEDTHKKKYYVLDMFPYPSGAGLHVGHPIGYTATDIIGRYKKSCGYNVLHPMGWDAFGLPAEQHSIKTKTLVEINTQNNIKNFTKQIKKLGYGIDWSREINTTDSTYYYWTQWIFFKFFQKGLAYVEKKNVWWCEKLNTVLANEEIINGKSSVGDYPVKQKLLNQWVLRITNYSENLLKGLNFLKWPNSTKKMQKEWIGKYEGMIFKFLIENSKEIIYLFFKSLNELLNINYIIIHPSNLFLKKILDEKRIAKIRKFFNTTAKGIFSGKSVIHPILNIKIPIFIVNFFEANNKNNLLLFSLLNNTKYYNFLLKYNMNYYNQINYNKFYKNIRSIFNILKKKNNGILTIQYKINDWLFSRQRYWGEPFPILWIHQKDYCYLQRIINQSIYNKYLPSIPVSSEKQNNLYYAIPIIKKYFPIKLPKQKINFNNNLLKKNPEAVLDQFLSWKNIWINLLSGEIKEINHSNNSKLSRDKYWVKAIRETNTMPQWAGSCWYYLRYMDPDNTRDIVDVKKEQYWKNPDLYIGGSEHAVLHLLYARFWHFFLYDLGILSTKEPFPRILHQGIILGKNEFFTYKDSNGNYYSFDEISKNNELIYPIKLKTADIIKDKNIFVLKKNKRIKVLNVSSKMSKSKGNIINPDDIIKKYGADALRIFLMFMGPLESTKIWDEAGVAGIYKFLSKIWKFFINKNNIIIYTKISEKNLFIQKIINKVTKDINNFNFNTAIANLMILFNFMQKLKVINISTIKLFLQMISPFAPHLSEEIWYLLGYKKSIILTSWPSIKEYILFQETKKLKKYILQINGRFKGMFVFKENFDSIDVVNLAKNFKKIYVKISNIKIINIVFIKNKIINFLI